MKLDKLYSLRSSFVIIGLTGRVGGGCSVIAKTLSGNDILDISKDKLKKTLEQEEIKRNICYQFLSSSDNWQQFETINYKDVLLLHVIFECMRNPSPLKCLIKILCQNEGKYINRFTSGDKDFFKKKLT